MPVGIRELLAPEIAAPTPRRHSRPPVSGAIDIESAKARLGVEGAPDPTTLRLVLECLLG